MHETTTHSSIHDNVRHWFSTALPKNRITEQLNKSAIGEVLSKEYVISVHILPLARDALLSAKADATATGKIKYAK